MNVQPGELLFGYCNGYFGRDGSCYSIKRVDAVGPDWIVARSVTDDPSNASPQFADLSELSLEDRNAYLQEWKQDL